MPIVARKKIAPVLIAILALGPGMAARAAGAKPDPWLGLAGGHLGAYRWSVQAKRPRGPAGAGQLGTRRPCLLVGTIWKIGAFDYHRSRNRECAGRAGLIASGPPLVASGAQPSTGVPPKMTAIGLIAAPGARRVQITFGDGSRHTVELAALSPLTARRAGLKPFRYAGFAVRGEWCAERLVTESATGRMLWDSGVDSYRCGDRGPPRFEEG